MSENSSESGKKRGCAPLGCLIIIVAIAAVLFYFFVKPRLDERGITIDRMSNKIIATKNQVDEHLISAEDQLSSVSGQAADLHEETRERLYELKAGIKEKMPKTPIKLYEE